MDVATLKQQLKTAPPAPIYVVVGTQSVLMNEAKQAFLQLIPKEDQVMNVGSYDLEEDSLADAMDDAIQAPFFGERRLVLLNKPLFLTSSTKKGKVQQKPDVLKKYLANPQPSTILVILAPYAKLDGRKGIVRNLKKSAVQVEATPLKEGEARKQVEKMAREQGYVFGAGALDELVRRTNADFSEMVANLSKLELLAVNSHEINVAEVTGLVPQSLDDNVFDLVSAVLERQQDRAMELYQQLIDAQREPLQINAILVSQFRLLLQLKILSKRGMTQGSLASKLNVHPYRVKLGLQTARRFSLLQLMNAYLGLMRTERALKTSQQSPELLFQLFMLQYSQQLGKTMNV